MSGGPVGEYGVGSRCQLGSAGTFEQHRMGEALDPGKVGTRRLDNLLNRCPRPDSGLNLLGSEHVCDLIFDFAGLAAGYFSTNGGA